VTRGTLQEGGGGTQQQATLYAFDKLDGG